MKRLINYLAYLFLIFTLGFHLWLNYPETQILADPNDNVFQYSLIARTDWVWGNYGCPLSLSCLPNLTDHVVTSWAEGYPLPFYYSHIPQIFIVGSYHLLVQPISSILHFPFSLPAQAGIFHYFNLTKYLLLCFFPLSIFLALRLVGFSPIASSLAAFFGSNFSTDGLYGIDPPSFLWRGYGLTSQLYAMTFLPIGIAFIFRALRSRNNNIIEQKILSDRNIWLAGIFLTLTTSGHLGMGILGLVSTIPFLFSDLRLKNIFFRFKKILFITSIVVISLAYWIIPAVLHNDYHLISFWDPIWKFDSYGWYEVVRQFFQGEIFDWQRIPVVTVFVAVGFFALLTNKTYFPFSLLFALWFLLYFGRNTWGGLIDLIPGMKDFHQHRFIVLVQIAALFLIPGGLKYIFNLINQVITKIMQILLLFKTTVTQVQNSLQIKIINIVIYILVTSLISILIYLTVQQTIKYATLNNRWIGEANQAYLYDEKNFLDLASFLDEQPKGRVYAGRPGNWGKQFRLGSTQIYMLLGISGFDVSQFLPETWSPMSENEQNFDERALSDYDLLNIRYIVAPDNESFPKEAEIVKKSGPFELYRVPTSGWFDVVTSPMLVTSDKTNFLNIVHYWHRSYPRKWKMHPLISVEKNTLPAQAGLPSDKPKKTIRMISEVDYEEEGRRKNIFADFPFVFPDSTVSAKILSENVNKQTYSAKIAVPEKCQDCFIMFKMSYHPDWKAKLDNIEVKKYSIFPFYMAIPVSSGEHTVEFYYEPNRLKIFLMLLELGLLGYAIYRMKSRLLIKKPK